MKAAPQNFWHQRFDQPTYFYGIQANDFIRQAHTQLPTGGRILSLGEGEGRNAVFLAEQGFEVTALDGAQSGLDKTQRLATKKGVQVHTLLADLQHYEFQDQAWDGIISVFCHLPPALRIQVHQSIYASLKPNGVFLLEAYTPQQLHYKTGGPSNIDLLYKADDLALELAPLHFKRLSEQVRDIHEGEGHKGASAVVQIIAKRLVD